MNIEMRELQIEDALDVARIHKVMKEKHPQHFWSQSLMEKLPAAFRFAIGSMTFSHSLADILAME